MVDVQAADFARVCRDSVRLHHGRIICPWRSSGWVDCSRHRGSFINLKVQRKIERRPRYDRDHGVVTFEMSALSTALFAAEPLALYGSPLLIYNT
jgi:hypothetical protein